MRSADLLRYAFDQLHDTLRTTLDGLGPGELSRRAAPGANPIPWLAWHLLRVQDDHVAGVADREQVWTAEGWADRFGLPFDASETGYGFDDDLDRVVDPSYDPPVTLGVRLVSVLSDDLQHLGQAAYVHGLVPGS